MQAAVVRFDCHSSNLAISQVPVSCYKREFAAKRRLEHQNLWIIVPVCRFWPAGQKRHTKEDEYHAAAG
jgi:hypothetical protein